MQVDILFPRLLFGVTTQGRDERDGADQWVLSYTISYSLEYVTWTSIASVFPGNFDSSTKVTNAIPNGGVTARYIRLYPVAYRGHESIRWDVIGCKTCVARHLLCRGTTDPVVTLTASTMNGAMFDPQYSCLNQVPGTDHNGNKVCGNIIHGFGICRIVFSACVRYTLFNAKSL